MLSLWTVHLHMNITDKEKQVAELSKLTKIMILKKMIEIVIKTWR